MLDRVVLLYKQTKEGRGCRSTLYIGKSFVASLASTMFVKNVLILLSGLLISAVQTSNSISHSCNPPDGFEDKLNRIVEYSDPDQDGVVTAKELDRNTILFDHNLDSFVSPYEFVSEWTCRYGDKPDVAYRIFNQLTSGTNLLTFELYRDIRSTHKARFKANEKMS